MQTATAETSPAAIASPLPARHGKAIQSGGSFLYKRLRNLTNVAGEECMHLDAQRLKLMLPVAGNGAAENSRYVIGNQLLAFVTDRCLSE